MPVVGVQVSAGGLDGCVAEDVLEDVQRDACVRHPGRAGVTEAVPGEVGQAKIADDLVPVRRVPQEFPDLGALQEGGYIEPREIPKLDATLYFNEAGPTQGLPFNVRASALWWFPLRVEQLAQLCSETSS